jgi:CDP-diacylglycerol--glycerol-3-phosphate 3-phosphatidyltransferase
MPHVARIALLPTRLPAGISESIGRAAARTGLTPNAISCIGVAGNAVAAYLVTRDQLLAAGLVYLACSLVDLVDGALARATGRATPYGAFLDAVLDRVSESVMLIAIGWYFADSGEQVQVALTGFAIFGSVAVSYMRARAEVVGLSMRDGLFRRQERVALVALGLLFDGLTLVIWPLAVLSNLTALQRFWLISKGLRAADSAGSAPA